MGSAQKLYLPNHYASANVTFRLMAQTEITSMPENVVIYSPSSNKNNEHCCVAKTLFLSLKIISDLVLCCFNYLNEKE